MTNAQVSAKQSSSNMSGYPNRVNKALVQNNSKNPS